MKPTLFLAALLACAPSLAGVEGPTPVNQVFQWVVNGTSTVTNRGNPGKASSYLWIPERCQKVRGLLILNNNVPEHRLVGHPAIRAVCAANDLGIVWSTPSFLLSDTKNDKGKWVENLPASAAFCQQQLEALAKVSGYAEVATVPWIPMGESGHLLMVDALVETKPEKCIAGIWIKNHHLPPKNRTVPALVIYGSAQEWSQDKIDIRTKWAAVDGQVKGVIAERTKNPAWPFSYVLDGHSGHFDSSERLTSFMAGYIDAIVKARLAQDGSLRPVDLAQGWVADLAAAGRPGTTLAAAKGPEPLPWYPAEALAKEAQAFAAINWKAQTQVPVFLDAQGKPMPHDFNGITNFKTLDVEADGLTFTVRPALSPTIPADFQNAGEPLAQAPGEPVAEWLSGPIEPLGNNRFRIALDRTWLGGAATYIGLRHAGTDQIRGVFQPAGIALRDQRALPGKPQKITFPALPPLTVGAPPLKLQATSDSGLPVAFFVVAGPAVIKDGMLELTPIPPRAALPITVTVGAWQWGRRTEPAIKIAEVVQQSLQVNP